MPSASDNVNILAPASVLRHVVDVHCHPTDSPISLEAIQALPITICAMATRDSDQTLVRDLATAYPDKVVPCFGYHPWFTHWISLSPGTPLSKEEHYRALFLTGSGSTSHTDDRQDGQLAAFEKLLPSLPEPTSLADLLSNLRSNLEAFPTAMLGEVGLDRTCRIPFDYNASPRMLSPFMIPFEHQLAVFEAQVQLAVELQRNVSFHSVNARKATIDVLARMKERHGPAWSRISVDMHSCGLSVEMWREIEKLHSNVFLSLSTVINARSPAHKSLIAAASPHRLLVESDINQVDQCASQTWDMLCTVAEVRGWDVEQSWEADPPENQWGAVRKLERNWKSFVKGGHVPVEKAKESKRAQKMNRRDETDWDED